MNIKKTILLGALALLPTAQAITVQDDSGNFSIAKPARRVVALEYSFLDTLVALGIKPVGAALGNQAGDRGAPPYLAPRVRGVLATGSRAQPNLELITAQKPDLILADAFVQKDLYPQLGRIAPTAAFQSRRADLDELSRQTLVIGKLVGRESVARQILSDQAGLIRKARAFARKDAPLIVTAVATSKTFTAHTSGSFVGSFLEDLGRKNMLPIKDGQTQYEISLEGLIALKPQTLVLFTDPGEHPITDEWKKSPLWQKIPAVARGRVYQFNRDNWTRGRGPLSLKLMVSDAIASRLLQDQAPTQPFNY